MKHKQTTNPIPLSSTISEDINIPNLEPEDTSDCYNNVKDETLLEMPQEPEETTKMETWPFDLLRLFYS